MIVVGLILVSGIVLSHSAEAAKQTKTKEKTLTVIVQIKKDFHPIICIETKYQQYPSCTAYGGDKGTVKFTGLNVPIGGKFTACIFYPFLNPEYELACINGKNTPKNGPEYANMLDVEIPEDNFICTNCWRNERPPGEPSIIPEEEEERNDIGDEGPEEETTETYNATIDIAALPNNVLSDITNMSTLPQTPTPAPLNQELDNAIAQVVRNDKNDDLSNLQLKLIIEQQFDCGPNTMQIQEDHCSVSINKEEGKEVTIEIVYPLSSQYGQPVEEKEEEQPTQDKESSSDSQDDNDREEPPEDTPPPEEEPPGEDVGADGGESNEPDTGGGGEGEE